MDRKRAAKLWDGWVGSQTAREFVVHTGARTRGELIRAIAAYAAACPTMFAPLDTEPPQDLAEGMLAHIEAAQAAEEAKRAHRRGAPGAEKEERTWYCGGCGDDLDAETTAAWHGGVAYCRGCEDAPADPPDADDAAQDRR